MYNAFTEERLALLREDMRACMTEQRFKHTLGVEQMAARLAALYLPEGAGMLRAAALLHDMTKELPREVQAEIRTMNNALVTLATELKHINEHLRRNESKLDNIENAPRARAQAITTAVIAALAGGLISALIGILFA